MSAKQKIVQGRGLSDLNLGTFVCSSDVYRASKPVPSINYGSNDYDAGATSRNDTIPYVNSLAPFDELNWYKLRRS